MSIFGKPENIGRYESNDFNYKAITAGSFQKKETLSTATNQGPGAVFKDDASDLTNVALSNYVGNSTFMLDPNEGVRSCGYVNYKFKEWIVKVEKSATGASVVSIPMQTATEDLGGKRGESAQVVAFAPNWVGWAPTVGSLDPDTDFKIDATTSPEFEEFVCWYDEQTMTGNFWTSSGFTGGSFDENSWNNAMDADADGGLLFLRNRMLVTDYNSLIKEAKDAFKLEKDLVNFQSAAALSLDPNCVYFPMAAIWNNADPDQATVISKIDEMAQDPNKTYTWGLFSSKIKMPAIRTSFFLGGNSWAKNGAGFPPARGIEWSAVTSGDPILNHGDGKPFVFLPHIDVNNGLNSNYMSTAVKAMVNNSKGYEIDDKLQRIIDTVETDDDKKKSDDDDDKKKGGGSSKPKKSPAQIRKEVGDKVRSFKSQGIVVVAYSPGDNSRLNTMIWDEALAFYCYANSKEESLAKKHAPTFYAGMWSPAYGSGAQINGRIESPSEMIRLMSAITRDAHKNKKGIFGNPKYKAEIEKKLGKTASKWPSHWISKNNKPGLGEVIGSIPGLEAYHPQGDNGTGYSSALFFKDLANDVQEPSGRPGGASRPSPGRDNSKGKVTTAPGGPVTSTKQASSPSKLPDPLAQVNLSSDGRENKNKFIVIVRPEDHPLYEFISKERIERILTTSAPTKTVADFNSRASVTLIFSRRGELKKVKTSSDIGKVITTDDGPFNKKIASFKKNVLADIKSEISGQKKEIAAAGIKNVRLTIENFSGARRLEEFLNKKPRNKIKTSRAFKND